MGSLFDYLREATRDVIGGGFGGLIAAWAIADVDQRAITILGLLMVGGLMLLYFLFDWLGGKEEEEELASSTEDEEASLRWPLHQAS